MRTVKLVVVGVIVIALMILMAANMAPVDLHLIPESFAPGLPTLPGVPVAFIIVAALLAGIIVGFLLEFAREAKHRRRLDEKRRELSQVRDQNARLVKRLEERGDDVAALTG